MKRARIRDARRARVTRLPAQCPIKMIKIKIAIKLLQASLLCINCRARMRVRNINMCAIGACTTPFFSWATIIMQFFPKIREVQKNVKYRIRRIDIIQSELFIWKTSPFILCVVSF